MSSIHVSSQSQSHWKIEKQENDGLEVHVTIGENVYRIKSMTIDGQLIDLSNPALESYANRVGELATKTLLAMHDDIPDRRNFKVSLAKSQTGETAKVTHDRDEKFSTELNEPQLLQEIEGRARTILHGKAYTEALREVNKKKELSNGVKIATKVGTGLIAAITLPVVAPVVGLTRLAHAISSRKKGPVRSATEKLQLEEAQVRNNTLRNRLFQGNQPSAIKNQFPNINVNSQINFLRKKLKTRLENRLQQFATQNDPYQIKKFLSELDKVDNEHLADAKTLRKFLVEQAKNSSVQDLLYSLVSDGELEQIIKESKLLTASNQDKKQILKNDKKKWEAFVKAVMKSPEDNQLVKQNNKVLKAFREVLQSDTYQALKNDPHNEFVQMVQGFALAMYGDVSVIESCKQFGDVLDKGNQQDLLHQQLRVAHESAKSENMNTDGRANFVYQATHIDKALSALSSQGRIGAEIAKMFGSEEYDSHLLGNTPSHQGTQTTNVGNRDAKVEISYSGSPFVGDEVAPEFLAVLDAIRNNNSAGMFRSNRIPSAMVYTNLQKFTGAEGERSQKLMALMQDYREVFYAHTQTKDGPFYEGTGDYAMKEWTGAEDFGNVLLHELKKDVCYQYMNRGGKDDPGIYLPFSKQEGEVILPKIIAKANQHFAHLQRTDNPELIKKYRYAYQEYVYFMVQAYIENNVASHVGPIMAIRACKENKDRGGAHNLKDLFVNFQGDPEEKVTLLAALQNYRALAAGDTTILEHRIEPIWAFFEFVDPDACRQEVAEFLTDSFKKDVSVATFNPSNRQLPVNEGQKRREKNKSVETGVELEFERVEQLRPPQPGSIRVESGGDTDSGSESDGPVLRSVKVDSGSSDSDADLDFDPLEEGGLSDKRSSPVLPPEFSDDEQNLNVDSDSETSSGEEELPSDDDVHS